MGAAIPIIAAATGLIGTGYSIYSGEQQRKRASAAMDEESRKQQALELEAKNRSAEEQRIKELDETRNQQASIKRKNQYRFGGKPGTILTGPLGVINTGSSTSGKTLLGM